MSDALAALLRQVEDDDQAEGHNPTCHEPWEFRISAALRAAGVHLGDEGLEAAHVWVGDHGTATGGNVPLPTPHPVAALRDALAHPEAVEELARALRVVTRGTWSTPARRHPDEQKAQDERWLAKTAAAIAAAVKEAKP